MAEPQQRQEEDTDSTLRRHHLTTIQTSISIDLMSLQQVGKLRLTRDLFERESEVGYFDLLMANIISSSLQICYTSIVYKSVRTLTTLDKCGAEKRSTLLQMNGFYYKFLYMQSIDRFRHAGQHSFNGTTTGAKLHHTLDLSHVKVRKYFD